MEFKHVLITGGAGFVGSNLARMLREAFPDVRVTALDSLTRRGSELNLDVLRRTGVSFRHGDIRCVEDLRAVSDFDLLIDCSAEPAVSAGLDGAPARVLETNLAGTLNCLEQARLRSAAFLFLSTSRVYPLTRVNALDFVEEDTRHRWRGASDCPGFSLRGIAEDFPMDGPRSLYGASKLAAELVVAEYAYSYGVHSLVDRCGIIAGPGQLSRVDQGVVTHWISRHYFRQPLRYIGFGGEGKQVRDVLHVRDLFDLIVCQLASASDWNGAACNVGGGPERSVSLRELTALCESLTGNRLEIGSDPTTSAVDVRIFITDTTRAAQAYGWQPRRGVEEVLQDIHTWIDADAERLRPVLAR